MRLSAILAAGLVLAGAPAAEAHHHHVPRTQPVAIIGLIVAKAQEFGVPANIALAVAMRESGLRCNAVGPATRGGRALGPLQIMPGSARGMFGYSGPASALASCGAGLHYGMAHLAICYRQSGGSLARTARCHQTGPRFTARR